MKYISKLLIICFILFSLISCSKKDTSITKISENDTPENLYILAKNDLDNKDLENALLKFKDINYKFPLSNEAVQSQIMIAFIEYLKMNYNEEDCKLILKRYDEL